MGYLCIYWIRSTSGLRTYKVKSTSGLSVYLQDQINDTWAVWVLTGSDQQTGHLCTYWIRSMTLGLSVYLLHVINDICAVYLLGPDQWDKGCQCTTHWGWAAAFRMPSVSQYCTVCNITTHSLSVSPSRNITWPSLLMCEGCNITTHSLSVSPSNTDWCL